MDFGTSREEQRNAGIALLVIDIVMIVCMVIVGCVVYKLVSRHKEAKGGNTATASGGGGVSSSHPMQTFSGNVAPPPRQAPYYPSNATANASVQPFGASTANNSNYSPVNGQVVANTNGAYTTHGAYNNNGLHYTTHGFTNAANAGGAGFAPPYANANYNPAAGNPAAYGYGEGGLANNKINTGSVQALHGNFGYYYRTKRTRLNII